MVFRLASTFSDPAQGSNAQRGFPAPGTGAQNLGGATAQPAPTPNRSSRPTRGSRTFFKPAQGANAQRGFPAPGTGDQIRPPGSMPNILLPDGSNHEVYTPYFSRGAAAYVQNYGKVTENPIGAGIPVPYRTQASYGPAAQYDYGALWWTSQVIPTTINLQGLTDPEALNEILGSTLVQAVVRTTG
jgi:hypothetical protein